MFKFKITTCYLSTTWLEKIFSKVLNHQKYLFSQENSCLSNDFDLKVI